MEQGQIRIAKNSVTLENVVVTDTPTVALVTAAPSDDRLGVVLSLIQLGSRVQSFANDQLAATTVCDQIEASADSVGKLLSSITKTTQSRIDETIASVFGANGKPGTFTQNLGAQLKVIEAQLSAQLDPQKATSITGQLREALRQDSKHMLEQLRAQTNLADPASPFGVLKCEIDAKLKGLDEKLNTFVTQQAVHSAITTEKVRGTQKGADFEEVLHLVLGRVCRPRRDKVERTGNERGLAGASKCGDFVVEINPQEARASGLRIVIEAKNDSTKQRDLLRELDSAMENRGAQFAIGISTYPGLLPPGSIPVVFPEPNKALVYVPDFALDSPDFEALYIEVALDVARAIAIATRESQPCKIDIGSFTKQIDAAIGALGRFSEIRKRLTGITNTTKEADTLIETIRGDVRSALQSIRDALAAELARESLPDQDVTQRKSA